MNQLTNVPAHWFGLLVRRGNQYSSTNWFWFIGSDQKSESINQLTNIPTYWFGLLVRRCNQYLPLIGFWFIGSGSMNAKNKILRSKKTKKYE